MKKLNINNKKGYFFSLDALIAIILLIGILLFINPVVYIRTPEVNAHQDALQVMSSITIEEYAHQKADEENNYWQNLIQDGTIENTKNSLLEQIVEFDALGDTTNLESLTKDIFTDLNYGRNIGLWFIRESGGTTSEDLIYSSTDSTYNEDAVREVYAARQIITGLKQPEPGESITGFASHAKLSRTLDSEYFYFGGFVGQGTVIAKIKTVGVIHQAKIEGVFSQDFNVYVSQDNLNWQQAGTNPTTCPASPDVYTPVECNIIDTTNFVSGNNYIKLEPTGDEQNFFISGGYIRILYRSENDYTSKKKFYLPGINGIINLYDSFYVPAETITGMKVHLKYKNNYDNFFSIGGETIFSEKSETLTEVTLDDNYLLSIYDTNADKKYDELAGKTIPIRYGLEEFSQGSPADTVLITDTSGSMGWRLTQNRNGVARDCDDSKLYNDDTKRISLAKCYDYDFVDNLLVDFPQNRISAVRFSSSASGTDLKNDKDSLKLIISNYIPSGNTCLCCAIELGIKKLDDSDNKKFMVVMSDGVANKIDNTCLGIGGPKAKAIDAAKRAYVDNGIIVYSIGFGSEAVIDKATLQAIADQGGGEYYSSGNPEELERIYEEIARAILEATYAKQVIDTEGQEIDTLLSPESYIELEYDTTPLPYGEIITAETDIFNDDNKDTQHDISLPEAEQYLEANAISYSGDLWTDEVHFKPDSQSWEKIFDINDFWDNLILLGDPYVVNIPNTLLKQGNNLLKIWATDLQQNEQKGSLYNKVIYTIRKNYDGLSPVKPRADGCLWKIEFFDGTTENICIYTADSTTSCDLTGTPTCHYTSTSDPDGNGVYGEISDSDDAVQISTLRLLQKLDLDAVQDGIVDVKFTQDDLEISDVVWEGIPFTWATEVQVRIWRN